MENYYVGWVRKEACTEAECTLGWLFDDLRTTFTQTHNYGVQ